MNRTITLLLAIVLLLVGIYFGKQYFGSQADKGSKSNVSTLDDNLPKDNGSLFKEYYQPQGLPPHSVTGLTGWGLFVDQYQKQEYQAAATTLETLIADPAWPNRSRAYYFLAHSHLNQDNHEQAISFFNKVKPDSRYGPDAEWYKALLYIKTDNVSKAREVLDNIIKFVEHPYNEKGARLIKKLQ